MFTWSIQSTTNLNLSILFLFYRRFADKRNVRVYEYALFKHV